MAWTAPGALGATFNVSEVVTAAKMNAQISDNLRYLKGLDGAVALSDALAVAVNVAAAAGLTVTNASANSNALTGVVMNNDGPNVAGLYRNSSTNTAYGGVNSLNLLTTGAHAFGFSTSNALRMLLDLNGNLGIGTGAPQGRLHAVGAGGGMLFLSANAVNTTLQTLTGNIVLTGAIFVVGDINNGTLVANAQLLDIEKGTGVTYINGDSMRLDITAGGAITIKTSGGANTHQWQALCLYY